MLKPCFSTSLFFPCIPEVWTFLRYKLSSITTLPACQKSTFTGLAGQPVRVSGEIRLWFAGQIWDPGAGNGCEEMSQQLQRSTRSAPIAGSESCLRIAALARPDPLTEFSEQIKTPLSTLSV